MYLKTEELIMTNYTMETLINRPFAEVRDIAKMNGIKFVARKKEDIINDILASQTDEDTAEPQKEETKVAEESKETKKAEKKKERITVDNRADIDTFKKTFSNYIFKMHNNNALYVKNENKLMLAYIRFNKKNRCVYIKSDIADALKIKYNIVANTCNANITEYANTLTFTDFIDFIYKIAEETEKQKEEKKKIKTKEKETKEND